MPGSYFEVISQANPAPQLHTIQLKEIPPLISKSTIWFKEMPLKSSYDFYMKNICNYLFVFDDRKWRQAGITVAEGNGQGNQLDQLFHPCGIVIDDDQTIYIAD